METEVAPQILSFINEARLSGPRLSPVDIVEKMGVFDAREKAYEVAWLASGDNIIISLWAEYVNLSAEGRWFFLEPLDTQRRAGGGTRTPSQSQRYVDRLALLKRCFKEEKIFRAVLQTNRVAIAEFEVNKSAKVSTRVRDADEWHVAEWNVDQQFALLVRGPSGWKPTDAELKSARERCGIPEIEPPTPEAANANSPEAVQAAAVEYVTKHFRGYGYKAENMTAQNVGYDLEVSNAKGATLLKVTVKGIARSSPTFKLTKDELAGSTREPLWRLLVVSDATSTPQHKIYKPTEIEQADGFEPL